MTLEGIALSVDRDFKILGAAYPYFARRLLEESDPELRRSLRDMLFDGEDFRWNRLEDLVMNAARQQQLDIEGLLDQTLDFLFSRTMDVPVQRSSSPLREPRRLFLYCVD